MKTKHPVCFAVAALILTGCTFPSRYPVYQPNQVGQMMRVDRGEVLSVENAVIAGSTSTRIGALGGAAVGSAAAIGAGSGVTGQALAQAGAGVAGAVLGNAVEDAVSRKPAQTVTVRLTSGEVIAIVRETGKDPLMAGDMVQVLVANDGATTLRRL